jgi:tRNA nucleotidyltransferase (CCA-adding enzyme)
MLVDDLARRDFTVNALAVDLSQGRFGQLLDCFGGLQDLRARKLRVLHGLSFVEDPTRALRAVELAARLEFDLSPRTARLIGVAVRIGAFERLSAQRLRRELDKVLEGPHPVRAVQLLARLGLLRILHPRLRADRRTYRGLARLARILRQREDGAPLRRIAVYGVLLHGLDDRARRELLDRLQPSRSVRLALQGSTARAHRLAARLLRWGPTASPGQIHATCRAEPPLVPLLALALFGHPTVRRALILYRDRLRAVRLDITARDLLRAGVPEGPAIGVGLRAAWAAKLEGRGATAAQQLAAALAAIRGA